MTGFVVQGHNIENTKYHGIASTEHLSKGRIKQIRDSELS